MNIQDENVTYRTQPHEMCIEGMTDKEPTINEIDKYCVKNNYSVDNIRIWFDHMQQIWRFNGDIKQI